MEKKYEVNSCEEAHDALTAIADFYKRNYKAPPAIHILADAMYLMFGNKKGLEALEVVDKALTEWSKKGG